MKPMKGGGSTDKGIGEYKGANNKPYGSPAKDLTRAIGRVAREG